LNAQELLRALGAGPASGDALARRFGLTRAAVWKQVQALRDAGVPVDAMPGRGYALAQPLDLLDGEAIRRALSPAASVSLAGLEVAWSLDSTNAALLREAVPECGARVLLAERQRAGRGRQGRLWHSPLAANLYLSVSRAFSGGLARLGGLGLVAGVAVADALHAFGASTVRLKWPNDLVVCDAVNDVVGSRKLGGLLVEGSGQPAGSARAVIGLGLNVRMPAESAQDIDQPWTDLASVLDAPPARSALAAAVLDRLLPALEDFDREGLGRFLEAFARYDALRGRQVLLHTADGPVPGLAVGVAEDGALRVEIEGRERRVHSGEVSVRAA
jgi:BirA family biotin operon repressor/biotin-[acetyl-CoA-carboxylase] ligase